MDSVQQLIEVWWHRFPFKELMRHASLFLLDDGIHFLEFAAAFRVIIPGVASPAFFTFERGHGDCLGDTEQVPQIQGIMPGRVVLAVSLDPDPFRPLLEVPEEFQPCFHFILGPDNARMQFHRLLQV